MKYKFRVWDYNKGDWHPNVTIDSDGSLYPMTDMGDYDLEVEYRSLVIQLFTGKLDKNGKEIFDGDIVEGKWPYCTKGVITWDDKRCGFYVKPIDGLGRASYDKGYKMSAAKPKVIGNIYANPELLTK